MAQPGKPTKALAVFKDSLAPQQMLSAWNDLPLDQEFFLDLQEAQITTDMESLTAEKRTKILQANKVLLVQTFAGFGTSKKSFSVDELQYCIAKLYGEEDADWDLAHDQAAFLKGLVSFIVRETKKSRAARSPWMSEIKASVPEDLLQKKFVRKPKQDVPAVDASDAPPPLKGPMVPAMPPPDCLQAVMAGLLVMEPPIIDPTLQYKQNFKAMMEQRKGKQPMRDENQVHADLPAAPAQEPGVASDGPAPAAPSEDHPGANVGEDHEEGAECLSDADGMPLEAATMPAPKSRKTGKQPPTQDGEVERKRASNENGPLWKAYTSFLQMARTDFKMSQREALAAWKQSTIREVLISGMSEKDKKRRRLLR